MTRGLALLLLCAALFGYGQVSGFNDDLVERAGQVGIDTAADVQEHIGGMVAPSGRMQVVEDLTREIDALG